MDREIAARIESLTLKPELPYISHEIVVEEILSRLPIKSLLRFQCVSKPWCASISNPNFFSKIQCLAVLPCSSGNNYFHIVHHQKSSEEVFQFPVPVPVRENSCRFRLLNSSGGLLLLHSTCRDFFLFNPSTRVLKKVLGYPLEKKHDVHQLSGALMYDSSTSDYKVIIKISDGSLSYNRHYNIISVGSVSSRTWKNTKVPYDQSSDAPVVLFDGLIYWLAAKKHETRDYFIGYDHIVCFDTVEDKFTELSLPEIMLDKMGVFLGIIDGCLAFCRQGTLTTIVCMEIWVMKEYGVKGSWSILFTIDNRTSIQCWNLKEVHFTDDGEALLVYGLKKIIAYNWKEQTQRDISPKTYGSVSGVILFKPSLLSPP